MVKESIEVIFFPNKNKYSYFFFTLCIFCLRLSIPNLNNCSVARDCLSASTAGCQIRIKWWPNKNKAVKLSRKLPEFFFSFFFYTFHFYPFVLLENNEIKSNVFNWVLFHNIDMNKIYLSLISLKAWIAASALEESTFSCPGDCTAASPVKLNFTQPIINIKIFLVVLF